MLYDGRAAAARKGRNCVSPPVLRTLAAMSASSALVRAFRLLVLGLLLAGIVIKPSVAIAEEMHELVSHALVAGDGHTHEEGHAIVQTPAPDGGQPHDDNHFHLTHCCGQQAAVLPRLALTMALAPTASPIPLHVVAFVPAPRGAPFRPPIAA